MTITVTRTTQRAENAPIDIADYDPKWPAAFDDERLLLEQRLAIWLAGPIEHIGSTAVPGLCAKPIIDIMAPVASLQAAQPAIEALRALQYQYWPYKAHEMHWFCKPSPAVRTHHLHLVPLCSDLYRTRIIFRDTLRNDPALAARYAMLKRERALRFRHDRDGYTEAKTPLIQEVLAYAGCAAVLQAPAVPTLRS
jgi:GrpB-like predicted nucleotidyltransferase (UPF0157 family)